MPIQDLYNLELEYVEQLQTHGITFVSLVMIIGVVGNVHAILVYDLYYDKSNHKYYILWLSTVDLLGCCTTIPMAIARYANPYTFSTDIHCKFRMFFDTFFGGYSMMFLGIIAADRCRRISRPLKKQLGPRGAQKACIITCFVILILSVMQPNITSPNSEQTGKSIVYCMIQLDFSHATYVIVEAVAVVLLFSLCFVLYSIVLWNLLRHDRVKPTYKRNSLLQYCCGFIIRSCKHNNHTTVDNSTISVIRIEDDSHQSHGSTTKNDVAHPSNILVLVKVSSEAASESEQSTNTTNTEIASTSSADNSQISKKGIPEKDWNIREIIRQSSNNSHLKKGRRVTIMFLVVTACSFIAYTPTIVFSILISFNYGELLIKTLKGWYGVMTFFYLLNHAINPMVYGFLDTRFRKKCKKCI